MLFGANSAPAAQHWDRPFASCPEGFAHRESACLSRVRADSRARAESVVERLDPCEPVGLPGVCVVLEVARARYRSDHLGASRLRERQSPSVGLAGAKEATAPRLGNRRVAATRRSRKGVASCVRIRLVSRARVARDEADQKECEARVLIGEFKRLLFAQDRNAAVGVADGA